MRIGEFCAGCIINVDAEKSKNKSLTVFIIVKLFMELITLFSLRYRVISFVLACAVLCFHQRDGLKTVPRTVLLTPFQVPLIAVIQKTKNLTAMFCEVFALELIILFSLRYRVISFVLACAVLCFHQRDGLKTVPRTVLLTPFRIPLIAVIQKNKKPHSYVL